MDAATAFEVLSIDIADVDVAGNVGARLQAERAEADKQIAQAKAEVRRAAAVATEQEMAAKTQEMRAKVVEAEAQIPILWRKPSATAIWECWTTPVTKTWWLTPK